MSNLKGKELLDALNRRIDDGLIRVQHNEDKTLSIYNYTEHCQFGKHWDNISMMCRGLILDKEGNMVARPFRKFFNIDEMPFTKVEGLLEKKDIVEISSKLDGSLGIFHVYNSDIKIATRGSFNSIQSIEANKILHEDNNWKAANKFFELYPHYTPLFEILYPDNRIVVSYGDKRAITLIGIVDKYSGKEFSYLETKDINKSLGDNIFETVDSYTGSLQEALDLVSKNIPNTEGYVIRFEDGLRVKIKNEEYKRLHRIVTGLSENTVWQYLSRGESNKGLLESIPEELIPWVTKVRSELLNKYSVIESEAKEIVSQVNNTMSRKEIALYFLSKDFIKNSILFAMVDKLDYSQMIWRCIEPSADSKIGIGIKGTL